MPAKKQAKKSTTKAAGAKAKKTTGKKVSIKMKDLKAKKNPKGGASYSCSNCIQCAGGCRLPCAVSK
jgi:hypothetical protein